MIIKEDDNLENHIKTVLLTIAVLLLTGCYSEMGARVNISDTFTTQSKDLYGGLSVAVDCTKKGSEEESSELKKVKRSIVGVIPHAQFDKCFFNGKRSYARFSLPFVLDAQRNGELADETKINILNNGGGGEISIEIPEGLLLILKNTFLNARSKQEEAEEEELSSKNLTMLIRLINDTNQHREVRVYGSYVDNVPKSFDSTLIKPGGNILISFGDVVVDAMLKKGWAKIGHVIITE